MCGEIRAVPKKEIAVNIIFTATSSFNPYLKHNNHAVGLKLMLVSVTVHLSAT